MDKYKRKVQYLPDKGLELPWSFNRLQKERINCSFQRTQLLLSVENRSILQLIKTTVFAESSSFFFHSPAYLLTFLWQSPETLSASWCNFLPYLHILFYFYYKIYFYLFSFIIESSFISTLRLSLKITPL